MEFTGGTLISRAVGGVFEGVALFCHFILDFLCYKEGVHDFASRFTGHHRVWSVSLWYGTIAFPVTL